MKRRWTFLATAIFLGMVGCGRGCTCLSGEKTYEHLDGKVRLELVRTTRWTGGRIPGPIASFVVRVHTDPPFDEPTGCEKVDLAEDEEGKNVAFRCDKTDEWTVIRLRGKDRHIRECKAPVGTGNKPTFAALARIVDVAPQLLDCATSREAGQQGERWAEIVTSVREEAGSAAATALVVSNVARSDGLEISSPSEIWDALFVALTPPERATVLATVCNGLLRPETPQAAYLRELRWCSLDNVSPVGDAALARLRTMLHGTAQRFDSVELPWIAALASRAKPAEAGAVACASGRDLRDREQAVLVALIARARIRCPAVAVALTPAPCDYVLDCDAGLCTSQELETELDGWVRSSIAGSRDDAGARILKFDPVDSQRALLAAAYAQGPLPRDILVLNERRRYPIADAGPSCDEPGLAENAPCTCRRNRGTALCTTPVNDKHVVVESCDIQIDDAKRRLDARRVCTHENGQCSFGPPCCAGLKCATHEDGRASCAVEPE